MQEIVHAFGATAILTHRSRLPRILVAELFLWPVSMRTAKKLLNNLLAHEQGKPSPHMLHFADFEERVPQKCVRQYLGRATTGRRCGASRCFINPDRGEDEMFYTEQFDKRIDRKEGSR